MSIRHRLLLIIFLVALLPALVVGYVNFTHTRDLLEQQALSNLERQALLKESEVLIYLKELYTRTIDFSSDGFIRDQVEQPGNDGFSVALSEHLKLNKLPLDSRIVFISAYRFNGQLVASTSDMQPRVTPYLDKLHSVNKWPYLATHKVGSGQGALDFFQPISSRLVGGERAGYLQIRYNIDLLNELVISHPAGNKHDHYAYDLSHMRDNSATYLVSQQGYLINNIDGIENTLSHRKIDTLPVTSCSQQGKSIEGRWQDHFGVMVLGSSHCIDIGEEKWTLVTEISQDEAYGAVTSSGYFLLVSLVFSLVLIVIAAIYLSNIIFRPIKSLHRSAEKISEGDWEHQAALKGSDELSDLSHTLDRMVDTLRCSRDSLEEVNEQLRKNNSELVFKQRALDEHTLVLEADKAGVIVSVNEALCSCSQYSESELVGQSITLLRPPNYSGECFDDLKRVAQQGRVWHGDLPGRRKDGSLYWVATTVVPFLDSNKLPERFLSIQTDITHQKMNEKKLSRSNRALTALAEMQSLSGNHHDEHLWAQAITDGLSCRHCYDAAWIDIYDLTTDGVINAATLTANGKPVIVDTLLTLTEQGLLNGEMVVYQHLERFAKDSPWYQYAKAGYYALIALPIMNQQQVLGHLQLVSTDPDAFGDEEVSILNKLVGEIAAGLFLMRTQSDKEMVEHQLSASALNLDQAQEIAQLGSCEWFLDEDYQVWSAQLYRMLGYRPDEVEASPDLLYKVIHVDDREMVRNAIEQLKKIGGVCNLEYRFDLDGDIRNITTKAKLDTESGRAKIVATMQDITDRIYMENERKTLETQLKQSQRLQAIGQLTGGIAHDFNNMLAAILGYTELAKTMALPDQANISNYLSEIEKAGLRARDLVQQMLVYSRRDKNPDMEVLDLQHLVADSLKMLKSTIPPSIAINSELDNDAVPLIKGTSVELHQIITNLVINARDALGEKGSIDIVLKRTEVDGQLCSSCQRYFSGHYAVVQVTDSGSGIPEQQLFSIFEPFFTTKDVGKGTGMGLSMVHGLVHRHDGHLCVTSQIGQGTCFELFFPIPEVIQNTKSDISEETLIPVTEIPANTRAMIVDDEESVATMIQHQLESIGLQPKVFFDSHQALAYFESHHHEIDLLVSDQAMPGLLGHEMIAKMREIKPNLPAVVCTGFSAKEVLELLKQVDGIEVICKPVDFDAFTVALQRVLGKRIS